MKLNMTIIADCLEDFGFSVVWRKTAKRYSFHIGSFMLVERACANAVGRIGGVRCQDGLAPGGASSVVYVCKAEDFSLVSEIQNANVISIGDASSYVYGAALECVVLAADVNPIAVTNALSQIFAWFNDWDERLDRAIRNVTDLHAIGEVGVEVFENDCCLIDRPQRMLFHAHPMGDERYGETFADRENAYFPKEQIEAFKKSAEYEEASRSKYPIVISNEGFLPYRTLQFLLFDEDVVVGSVTIDEIWRSLKQSDYSLAYYYGTKVKSVLLAETNLYRNMDSEGLGAMMRAMVVDGVKYGGKLEKTLARVGWSLGDEYVCALIIGSGDASKRYSLSQTALYFFSAFDEMHVVDLDAEHMLLVFNFSKSARKDGRFTSRIVECMSGGDCLCAISNSFEDFRQLPMYKLQAELTLSVGMEKHPDRRIYVFSEMALDVVLQRGVAGLSVDALMTRKLHNLIAGDEGRKGNLLETLRVYLRTGCNATKAMNQLGIQRTAFYHRLNRISQLSGLDLDSYRSRLYLMIVFEFLDVL